MLDKLYDIAINWTLEHIYAIYAVEIVLIIILFLYGVLSPNGFRGLL